MKHDNLWRANPDTAEEMDEIERRRKRAMRTAITLLALAVAVNVAVNEFSCVGPSPSKRDAAPAVQQSAPDDRGGSGAGRRRCGRRGARLVLGHRPRSGRGNAGRPGCGARRARGVLQGEGHRGVSRVRFGRAQLPVVDRLVLPGGGAAGFRRLESGRRRRCLLPGLRHVHGRPLGVFDRRV